eukprot:TRINITY_DN3165_c0_g1_i1.p1 TRINITY_DN3165_c0_g1~~TRINITY_DN3165_c0_g1_i1.p1  ORF type:complete len:200 (-),score=59.69 TRINITY_DN3165_c0_g1_i1:37-636(-)
MQHLAKVRGVQHSIGTHSNMEEEALFQPLKASYMEKRCSSSDSTDFAHSDEETPGGSPPYRLSPDHHSTDSIGFVMDVLELQESLAAETGPPPTPKMQPAEEPEFEVPFLELPEAYAPEACEEWRQGLSWRHREPFRSPEEELREEAEPEMEEGIFQLDTDYSCLGSAFADPGDEEDDEACTEARPLFWSRLNSALSKA